MAGFILSLIVFFRELKDTIPNFKNILSFTYKFRTTLRISFEIKNSHLYQSLKI